MANAGAGEWGLRWPGQVSRTSAYRLLGWALGDLSSQETIETVATVQQKVLFNTQMSSKERKGESQALEMNGTES